jgi:hypothetical protein
VTRIALITTTINVPTVLTQWAQSGMTEDDIIIVAGDQKSPHDEIIDLIMIISETMGVDSTYLAPHVQERYAVSSKIGWNCIQRRNIALLRAMEHSPEYILTIDDDNAPTSPRQVEILVERMHGTDDITKVISTNTGWYNPGRQCLTDDMRIVTHRGFPLSQRHVKPFYIHDSKRPEIGVAAMLWTGDPDIDAVERISNRPNITRVTEDVIVRSGTWAPFNTQATMFRGELGPAMFMFPHVGRYDDIWASYVTRKVMDKRGWGVFYGRPAVHQDRNEHDLIKDLQAEMFGMRMNEHFIETVREEHLHDSGSVAEDVARIYSALMDTPILTHATHQAMLAWFDDLEKING